MQNNAVHRVSDETRSRLIEAACVIFADVGYQAATTRQICVRAKANAAAVNYYFGDKLGLYTEVLKNVIGNEQKRLDQQALLSLPPEVALREFVKMMFRNLSSLADSDPYARLMAHEMSQPTESLKVVVEHMIRPRALVLCEIVGTIIGRPADATRTRLCAHSIIGQIMHHIHSRPVINLLWPDWQKGCKEFERLDRSHHGVFAGGAQCLCPKIRTPGVTEETGGKIVGGDDPLACAAPACAAPALTYRSAWCGHCPFRGVAALDTMAS